MNCFDQNHDELFLAVIEGVVEMQPAFEFRLWHQG